MTSTIVVERDDRLVLASGAHVVRSHGELTGELASQVPDWVIDESSPYVKWIEGNYVQSDTPNANGQFWAAEDLTFGEFSIKYSPLNINHRQRQPVGFYLATRRAFEADGEDEQSQESPFVIQTLAGMWSHVFPFEAAMVDAADEKGLLASSMECISERVRCFGPGGCDGEFDYLDVASHCTHLKERSSYRHLINPTFRGGALIIPPVTPGWKGATTTVFRDAVAAEVAAWCDSTSGSCDWARVQEGPSESDWESMMATVMSFTD